MNVEIAIDLLHQLIVTAILCMGPFLLLVMIIGIIVSRRVKDANDYYVAGRRAPVLLIAGSLIASYTSTGMFMGDAAQCYDGAFQAQNRPARFGR